MKSFLEIVFDMFYVPISIFFLEMCSSLQILSQGLQKISGRFAQVYCLKLYLLCAKWVLSLSLEAPVTPTPKIRKKVRKNFFSSIFVILLVWIGIKQRF